MIKRWALVLAMAATACAQFPERKVNGNVIASERNPSVQVQLPKEAKYLGADRWVLYGVADCELHTWVEADASKKVTRLYWIQFEAYVPEKPDATYTYDSPRHVRLGGMDFFLDTWARRTDGKLRGGSDSEHIQRMVLAKGYKWPAQMTYARLVHLPTPDKRKELMIIYAEALPETVNAIDIDENPAKKPLWDEIQKNLVEHAKQKIVVKP